MNQGTPLLRIIIPAHNEEHRIRPTIEKYCRHFAGIANITVVLNGCTDGSGAIVRDATKEFDNLDVLEIPAPVGKGGAVRCGFLVGAEPFVGFVDADLSFEPSECERLFSYCRDKGLDSVIGSRWTPEATSMRRRSLSREVGSFAFRVIRTVLFGLPYRDTQCGIKIFRRAALEEIIDDLELANFAFDVDILSQLQRRGAKIAELPVVWSDADGTTIDVFHAALSMFVALLRLRLRRSFLGNAPFVDLIARQSVMPVARKISLLVLRMDGAKSPLLDELIELWLHEGYGVEVRAGRRAPRWKFLNAFFERLVLLGWYTFVSTRQYDAIVEDASEVPALLPLLSVKRTFVVGSGMKPSSYASYDRNRQISFVAGDRIDAIYKRIHNAAALSNLYSARFLVSRAGPHVIYLDRNSGELCEQPVVPES